MSLAGPSDASASGAVPRSWGAAFVHAGEARFRVWAPGVEKLLLRLNGADTPMKRDDDGWFELLATGVAPNDRYCLVLPDGRTVPDPASRAQSGDVHGPSVLVDPTSHVWTDGEWRGRPWEEAVLYELHVGTFTPQGTFEAAVARLGHLARLGVTAIEIMPVAQFGGERGWGYDGVLPYAPHRAYGSPDAMKAFIDAAHGHGLMVLLDVVYNHFGPDGNYLPLLAPEFFDPDRHTPWGAAIAYEKLPVRQFFIENALYWLEEFHLDGLRFDAIDQVADPKSETEILVEIADRVRHVLPDRHIHLTTEDNRNIVYLHERDGRGNAVRFTAEWNDDFHNAAHVLATGETDGYYEDFAEHPARHLARTLAEGFAYQGEEQADGRRRGVASRHLPPTAFIDFIQNHDQIGNRALGERLSTLCAEPMLRVLTATLLLSPHIPLLFMGEEWGETNPFLFFTDFEGELAEAVRDGRRREFAKFGAFNSEDKRKLIPDPNARSTFEQSRIDWAKAEGDGAAWLGFVSRLLALRQEAIVPLLRDTGGNSGERLDVPDGVVAVDWTMSAARLHLRANFTAEPQQLPPSDAEVVFAEPATAAAALRDGELPPHSVVVAQTPLEGGRMDMNPLGIDELARLYGVAPLAGTPGSTAAIGEILAALGIDVGSSKAIDESLRQAADRDPPTLRASAGTRCYLPEWLEKKKAWGTSVQLYELRSDRNWGIGDFADLAAFCRIAASVHADFVGTNPLHALFGSDPGRCSPFSPSNRLFLNPLYIAVDQIAFYTAEGDEAGIAQLLRDRTEVDYSAVAALKLSALRRLWRTWQGPDQSVPSSARQEFSRFLERSGEALRRHALFEALSQAMVAAGNGSGWTAWPEEFRDVDGRAVTDFARANQDEVLFHSWLQWIADDQLEQCAAAAREAGMRIGIYVDFAVGEAPDGSATWSDRQLCVSGMSVGAPPDMFTANGQDWGLAPVSPLAMARTDFAAFSRTNDALMRHAGALRIDHVMSLWQLFFVPAGKTPAAGAYVRYPLGSLLRILAEQSNRHRTIVIGEDLGHVPLGFRDVMEQAGIFSYRIVYFEKQDGAFIAPEDYPRLALACLSTHDMPTLQGWWLGDDIELRLRHSLIDPDAARAQRLDRKQERTALVEALAAAGALASDDLAIAKPAEAGAGDLPAVVAVAANRFVAQTPSLLASVRLADLTGERRQTNLPGTVDSYPNWRLRSSMRLEDLCAAELFQLITGAMAEERSA